jgi:NodT family efflux transporter outer membrane factor (OMF) lipoprotein
MILIGFLMAGCMVGPDFVKPTAPAESRWLQAQDTRIKTEKSDYRDWWMVFNDPVLASLVDAAYQQNLPLQIAGIRVLEARAQLGISVGNLYPQLQQGRGDAFWYGSSDNAFGTAAGDSNWSEASLGFDAAWELDVWGRFRRAVESGMANFEASIASYDDTLVTLTAEVARTYVILRTFEERLDIARENVKIQQRSLEIAEVRFKAGAVTELDVQQAKSLLRDTEASIPRFRASIRQAKNALAILLGKLPGQIDQMLGDSKMIPKVPSEVVVDVPADLLRRRPDIRLAEYQVATQSALIGVAKSDLYPSFQLFGSIGLRSADSNLTREGDSDLGDLFKGDSFEYFAGPGFTWNLFNYGRITNQVRVQDARLQQLVVNYENTVINAQREVEDSLVGFLRKQEEAGFLSDSVNASQRSVDLSLIQYREGLVDYQRVLDTQRFLTQSQDLWTATRGDVVLNLVSTYKALGGGWQLREGKDYVPTATMEAMRERTNWGNLMTTDELKPVADETERGKWRLPDW